MKTVKILLAVLVVSLYSFTTTSGKLKSTKNHIHFFSHTDMEDISADNYSSVSTLDKLTGEAVFSVPMQSFQFEKALMQKHFNSPDFLDTKAFPKAKFIAKINHIEQVDFTKDGTYTVTITGNMTIKATTKSITEKGSIIINDGKVSVHSKFNLVLADYGISFEKGKPASNIAKNVEVTIDADYDQEI